MKKTLITLVILAVCGYAGFSYYKSYTAKSQAPTMARPMVEYVDVSEQSFYPTVSFVAKIESKDKIAVRARVTGFLEKRLFKEGDEVQKGQLLYQIEKDQFEADVRRAEGNLAQAEANALNAKAQYNRAVDLFKTKDVSEANLDQRKAEYDTSVALVKQAQSALDVAKLNLDYTDIRALQSGRIGESAYSEGALVGPDSGELARIVSLDPMYAEFSVSENQVLQLREMFDKGGNDDTTDIQFIFSNGRVYPYKGKLNFVDVALNEQMNTLKMRVSLPNPDRVLISGQYGRVKLTSTLPQKAILLPSMLVQRDLAGPFVYMLNAENQVIQQRITVGVELTDGQVVIESGLKIGDRVIANNFQKLSYMMGVSVDTKEVSADAFLKKEDVKGE